jgi:hypothetical protein
VLLCADFQDQLHQRLQFSFLQFFTSFALLVPLREQVPTGQRPAVINLILSPGRAVTSRLRNDNESAASTIAIAIVLIIFLSNF